MIEKYKVLSLLLLQFSTGHDVFGMSGSKSPASPMLSAGSGVSGGDFLLVPEPLSAACSSSPSCLSVPGKTPDMHQTVQPPNGSCNVNLNGK